MTHDEDHDEAHDQTMTTALYLILSSVLIGAGIGIIWRDVRIKSRATSRGSFTAARNRGPFADPDVEITIARGPEPELPRRAPPHPTDALAPLFVAGRRTPTEVLAADPPPMPSPAAPDLAGIGAGGANQPRLKARLALEQQWSALQPA